MLAEDWLCFIEAVIYMMLKLRKTVRGKRSVKVVIAIDSFKGCMSSLVAGNAAKKGVLSVMDADVMVFPVADGGEGTSRVLTEGMKGTFREVSVHDPLGNQIVAEYGILPDNTTAVMEMAAASGITLVPEERRDPDMSNTAGVGEMILDAVEKGCRDFMIGIGGSATTEAGIGMLHALGYRFYDKQGEEVPPFLYDMNRIIEIRDDLVPEVVKTCSFRIACDVKNPLCGKNGSVHVFGKQKGIDPSQMDRLDAVLSHFADIVSLYKGDDVRDVPGAGAAGGLGFAFLSFFQDVQLIPGIEMVCKAIGLDSALEDADYVLTGEGKIDHQTRMGKVPFGIATHAKRYGCTVYAFGGAVIDGAEESLKPEIDACFAISPKEMPLEEAMREEVAAENMTRRVASVFANM